MKDINLLPKIVKPKSSTAIVLNVVIIIFLIGAVSVAGLTFLLFNSKANLSQKLDNLEKINLQLKIYNDKLQAYKNFEDNVSYKSNLVKTIKAEDIIWSKKFYDISKVIPEKVNIISFDGKSDNLYNTIDQAKKGTPPAETKIVSFVIDGYAADYLEISKFIIGLKGIPEITDPWIVSINEEIVNNMKLLRFNIEAYWDLTLLLKDIKVEKQSSTNTDQNINLNETNTSQNLNNLVK